jgi:hypothetical protein
MFDAAVSGDVIAAQQAVIGEAGKGKIAGSVVTERPLLARSSHSLRSHVQVGEKFYRNFNNIRVRGFIRNDALNCHRSP